MSYVENEDTAAGVYGLWKAICRVIECLDGKRRKNIFGCLPGSVGFFESVSSCPCRGKGQHHYSDHDGSDGKKIYPWRIQGSACGRRDCPPFIPKAGHWKEINPGSVADRRRRTLLQDNPGLFTRKYSIL